MGCTVSPGEKESSLDALRRGTDDCLMWAIRFVGVYLGDAAAAGALTFVQNGVLAALNSVVFGTSGGLGAGTSTSMSTDDGGAMGHEDHGG